MRLFRRLRLGAVEDCVLRGVRARHRVDVVVRFRKWGLDHLWIVECKAHARRITKADVETLKSIASDTGAHRAFLLSEVGFQPGANDAARDTCVVLTSTRMFRLRSSNDILVEALNSLQLRTIDLQSRVFGLTTTVQAREGYLEGRIRRGVDGGEYFDRMGRLGGLRAAMDAALLGRFPTHVPLPAATNRCEVVSCSRLSELVPAADRLLKAIERWLSNQPS